MEVVRALLDAKADDDGTALIEASKNGHLEVVRALLAGRPDVNAKMVKDATALLMASQNGHLDVLQVHCPTF